MKKRQGFVSNSSSSSFCILGVSSDMLSSHLTESILNSDEDIESLIEKSDFNYEYGISDYSGIIVGVDPSCLDENKTIKESKEELVKKLNDYFHVNLTSSDLGFYTDGGYEG